MYILLLLFSTFSKINKKLNEETNRKV